MLALTRIKLNFRKTLQVLYRTRNACVPVANLYLRDLRSANQLQFAHHCDPPVQTSQTDRHCTFSTNTEDGTGYDQDTSPSKDCGGNYTHSRKNFLPPSALFITIAAMKLLRTRASGS